MRLFIQQDSMQKDMNVHEQGRRTNCRREDDPSGRRELEYCEDMGVARV